MVTVGYIHQLPHYHEGHFSDRIQMQKIPDVIE